MVHLHLDAQEEMLHLFADPVDALFAQLAVKDPDVNRLFLGVDVVLHDAGVQRVRLTVLLVQE